MSCTKVTLNCFITVLLAERPSIKNTYPFLKKQETFFPKMILGFKKTAIAHLLISLLSVVKLCGQ